jgi:hypothetical protein
MNRSFNLENFMIDIGPKNGYEFYWDNLQKYTNREIEELAGRVRKTSTHTPTYVLQSVKKGRLRLDIINAFCHNDKTIRPQGIRSKPYVLYRKGQKWERVPDEERAKIEGLLWNEICDGL